jgi:hypothetical protein
MGKPIVNLTQAAQLEMIEDLLKPIIKSNPKLFVIALNNVSSHGGVFEDTNVWLDDNDNFLNEWFRSIDSMRAAVNRSMTDYYSKLDYVIYDLEKVGIFGDKIPAYTYKEITDVNDKKYLKKLSDLIKANKPKRKKSVDEVVDVKILM